MCGQRKCVKVRGRAVTGEASFDGQVRVTEPGRGGATPLPVRVLTREGAPTRGCEAVCLVRTSLKVCYSTQVEALQQKVIS